MPKHRERVEAVLPMQASGVRFGLVVRVYNDGVAIRYILPEGAKHIGNERTAWALPQRVKKGGVGLNMSQVMKDMCMSRRWSHAG